MDGNLKMWRNFRFSNLLYLNFIVLKKDNVDDCAKNWKPKPVHRDTIYKKIRGANPCIPEDAANFTNATGNPEYIEFVANLCSRTTMPIINDKGVKKIFDQLAKVFESLSNERKNGE